jgi:hypothetical protein
MYQSYCFYHERDELGIWNKKKATNSTRVLSYRQIEEINPVFHHSRKFTSFMKFSDQKLFHFCHFGKFFGVSVFFAVFDGLQFTSIFQFEIRKSNNWDF